VIHPTPQLYHRTHTTRYSPPRLNCKHALYHHELIIKNCIRLNYKHNTYNISLNRQRHCDAPGFQSGLLTLMNWSTVLTWVKRRSTWAITSKTSPTTPNDPFWSTLVNPWSNPTQNPLNTPLPSSVSRYFCRVLQISPKYFKVSQCKSCVFCRGTQLLC
jgi:hypothetical protein